MSGGTATAEISRETPRFETFESFHEWALRSESRAEWVDGRVIFLDRDENGDHVPTSLRHQLLAGFLYLMLRLWNLRFQPESTVLMAPFAMRLPGRRAGREPDLLLILPESRERLKETYLDGPADLVVEIVSPESIDRDRDDKFFEYEAAGVREYWLIDPIASAAQFFVRDGTGAFRRIAPTDGVYESAVAARLTFRPEWLWQETLPGPETFEILWKPR